MERDNTCSRQRLSFICMLVLLGILFTGCSGKKDANGSMKAEDGRSYAGHIQADKGETVHTAFFDFVVEEALQYNTYQFEDGLYQADAGNTYLVVTVTIENTYDTDLSMSITDFRLDFEGNQADHIITGFGKADLNTEEFMDNIFSLKKGEKITKSILFTVEKKDIYTLNYTEYYEDGFTGNSFYITLDPDVRAAQVEQSETVTEHKATLEPAEGTSESSEEKTESAEGTTEPEEETTEPSEDTEQPEES